MWTIQYPTYSRSTMSTTRWIASKLQTIQRESTTMHINMIEKTTQKNYRIWEKGQKYSIQHQESQTESQLAQTQTQTQIQIQTQILRETNNNTNHTS